MKRVGIDVLYHVEGIVMKSIDYGEGNRIITLFSPEAGKITVMVRGAKKLKSRHSAISQMFTYGRFIFYKGKGMGTLNDGEILHSFHNLRMDLHKAGYASYIAEMLDRMTAEEQAETGLFMQFKAALEHIEQDKDAEIIAHLFEMHMLIKNGYMPELEQCTACGASSELKGLISIRMGGAL
ncbi:MAG: DNA repair protein RecO, partial [Paenibacillus sp. RIFOXYA1_FULL_44_5]